MGLWNKNWLHKAQVWRYMIFISCCRPPFTPQTSWNLVIRLKLCCCQRTHNMFPGRLPVWDSLMCCRSRAPGRDLEKHEHASCQLLLKWRREESLQSWWEENRAYSSSHIIRKRYVNQTGEWTGKWHQDNDSPLKYLSDDQEAQSDGYSHPEVLSFRVNFAIVVREVSPTVTFRKPNPVGPYLLPQPRQHPKVLHKERKGFLLFFLYHVEGN